MKRFLVPLGSLLLVACAGRTPPPEPIIQIKEVLVERPIPCIPSNLGEALSYPDTDERLGATRSADERYRLILAGRELRIARLAEVEPVIVICRRIAQ